MRNWGLKVLTAQTSQRSYAKQTTWLVKLKGLLNTNINSPFLFAFFA